MKINQQIFSLFLSLLMVMMLSACKTSKDAANVGEQKNYGTKVSSTMVQDNIPAENLAELLKRQPNITVTGTGRALSIRIRGSRSFNSTNEPLFVVEGRRMGHDFTNVAHIEPAMVRRINVVRDPSELAAYGSQGANGVIEILLKK